MYAEIKVPRKILHVEKREHVSKIIYFKKKN